jgi:hypothetical protein
MTKDKPVEQSPSKTPLMERIQELIEAGFLIWNGQKLKPTKPVAKTKGDKTVAEIVLENRE